jgi:hypothetical protein
MSRLRNEVKRLLAAALESDAKHDAELQRRNDLHLAETGRRDELHLAELGRRDQLHIDEMPCSPRRSSPATSSAKPRG